MGKQIKSQIIQTWVFAGIKDFFISFEFEDSNKWHEYSTYFCAQGLEKICKAYLIARESQKWENLESESEVLREIDKIAKSHNHRLKKLIENLKKIIGSNFSIENSIETRKYTENQLIEILECAYIEARYPIPNPIYKQHPISRKSELYHYPLGETAPLQYARKTALTVIECIKSEFEIPIPRDASVISSNIDERDWTRFKNLFFAT